MKKSLGLFTVVKNWQLFVLFMIGLFFTIVFTSWQVVKNQERNKRYHAYQFQDGSLAVCAEIDRSGASVSLFDCMNGRVYLCMTNVKRADDLMETKQ